MCKTCKLELEEWKQLREEVRSYSDAGFRDVQLLVTIFAGFAVLMASQNAHTIFASFWTYAGGQTIIFVFLMVQGSRLAYLSVLGEHLSSLEETLSTDNTIGKLSWESEVVKSKVLHPKSLSAQIRLVLGLGYLLLFYLISNRSLELLGQIENQRSYTFIVYLEWGMVGYILLRASGRFVKYLGVQKNCSK